MNNSTCLRPSVITLFFFFIISFSTFAQTVEVTFQVDMNNETVSSNGVHIAGNFQSVAGLGPNWTPGSIPLSDADGDYVYSITVEVPSEHVWAMLLEIKSVIFLLRQGPF
jgi:hypothetical protein